MQMDVYLLLSRFRTRTHTCTCENVPHPAFDVVAHFLGRRSHAYVIRIDRSRAANGYLIPASRTNSLARLAPSQLARRLQCLGPRVGRDNLAENFLYVVHRFPYLVLMRRRIP